jgi:hypothetical protein
MTDAELLNATDTEAEAVRASYEALARQVAAFPRELREIEPALRSIPGPTLE